MNHISSKLAFLTFFLRFVAVGLFIISQGIIENKMKEFYFFYFSRGYRALNTGCFPPSSPTARYAEHFEKSISHLYLVEGETEEVERWDRVGKA